MDPRTKPRTVGISPNPDCLKGVVACQCELGREKLLTAPPYQRVGASDGDESKSRYQTAPCARDLEQFKCPISHILVTFKSPLHPNEVFNKVFPANTPLKFVKRKLAKLLSVSNNNLLLTKNRTVLKETSLLSDIKVDPLGNMVIDVFTKDSEDFALSAIPKESYVHELLHSVIPKKKAIPFIAIKFRVRNQNGIFTRSYHSIMKVHEIKKNLAGLFLVDPDNLVMLRGERPLIDRMALLDLDYDKYGIVEVELLTKNNEKLNLDKLYKEMPVNDVLSVMVPFGDTFRQINVEIFSDPIKKPYLGGYRNVHSGQMDPRTKPRTVGISPNPDCLKGVVACQCELGREKLLTAPPYQRVGASDGDESKSRYQTAPCARDLEQFKCPISHILVTFKSPLHPNEVFNKVFPANTPLKFVKRKLAKLLSVSNNNLLLTKNRTVLKETSLLSDIKVDPLGNMVIDVFTKDSEDFALSAIPKESYVHELLHSVIPKKKAIPFIAIKFRVRNQNGIFTRSYHSIMKVHEIKKNLAGLFLVDPDNLVMLRGERPLIDRMALLDLDYDKYGIVEVELLTKNNEKLNLDKLYKEMPVNDVLSVMVPFGDTFRQINVEIFSDPIKKPYLGGYRNVHSGIVYHHAYTQTPQKPEKIPPENKTSRDTQTAEERQKIYGTSYSRSTQMQGVCNQVYIPNVNDRIVEPRPYETYDEMIQRLNHNHYAAIIQRAFRHYQFRQKVARWLHECMERIARMKEEDRLEREAMERRLRHDLITKTFPKTREDFDQLYAMVDRWKHAEIARISRLHAKGPKIAEFTLLLDKEVELLRCIEAYRVKVREDNKKIKERLFLDEISKPVAWYGRDGKLVTMETVEIQKARKLKELYNAFLREDMDVKERMELLVDMKFALQEFRHPLAEEIITLIDRECDLLVRRCNDFQLEFLRRRTATAVFQLIKTSELNSGVTKSKEIRDYREMENSRLHLCELCHQVKPYTDFPLNAKMSGFLICKSCSWKDVTERSWVDMTPYKFILRSVQRDERRRKCWGSLAFVLQEKDIFFIVEKLWHSHSAISECNDITELRLCRWNVNEDWSPWNCFLVTVQEMKAHLKLEDPEEVYDEELILKVKNKHKLAKANFEQLMSVNKRFTESGDWHDVRAPALARVDGVDRI